MAFSVSLAVPFFVSGLGSRWSHSDVKCRFDFTRNAPSAMIITHICVVLHYQPETCRLVAISCSFSSAEVVGALTWGVLLDNRWMVVVSVQFKTNKFL